MVQQIPIQTNDERTPVPLYHGTSKLFLPSIRSVGLGAKDPNVTFRTREMLDELVNAREWNWDEDPDLVVARNIIEQRVTRGGLNFRHGSAYLSPSKTTAVRYALNNRSGSEFLSTTFCMFEKLKTYDLCGANRIIKKYPELLKLYEMPHQPLLIEALDIPIRNLRSERGEDPAYALRMLMENADGPRKFTWEQCNFELIAPHSAANLKYYCIEYKNADSVFPEYSLKVMQPPEETMNQQSILAD